MSAEQRDGTHNTQETCGRSLAEALFVGDDLLNPAFSHPREERERMVGAVAEALLARADVVFAYVHGSVLSEHPFHDIDVAVYLARVCQAGRQVDALTEALSEALSEALAEALTEALDSVQGLGAVPPLDVRVLNEAPLGFCYQVLTGGRLLVSHDEQHHAAWIERTALTYLDSLPLRRQALKEAMEAIAACR